LLKKLSLHKAKVQALSFSPSAKYLLSLGGEDDKSIILWDVEKGQAISGAPAFKASTGTASCISFFKKSDLHFVTAGDHVLRIWEIDTKTNKLSAADVQMGQIKRSIICIAIDSKDENMYCGTSTGDLLEINLKGKIFKRKGPPKPKDNLSRGILSVKIKKGVIIVGGGDGTVAALNLDSLHVTKRVKLDGAVTSLNNIDEKTLCASTSHSNIYSLTLSGFDYKFLSTSHYSAINDLCFPENCSEIFVTASNDDIRIWNLPERKELLKISVQTDFAQSVIFNKKGSSLISGWNSGTLRAYGPQSGTLQFAIDHAHKSGVTALAVTGPYNDSGDYRLVSGGEDGQVRVWKITRHFRELEKSMNEHKETITCIKIKSNNKECVSASNDGSCIIWDLTRGVRNQVLFAPTFFNSVSYFPEESQILTVGTDRKVSYWEVYDGSMIREIEASETESIIGLDITLDGMYFAIGGSDKLVKMYKYEEGTVAFVGVGHSTDITNVKISPSQKYVLSTSVDGAIFVWNFPVNPGPRLYPPRLRN
jgi:WD40 repeat protein